VKTRNAFLLIGGVALGAAAGVLLGAALELGGPASADPRQQEALAIEKTQRDSDGNVVALSDFPVNSSGQTYGSSMGMPDSAQFPDLVSVWVDEDTIGYVPRAVIVPAGPGDIARQEDAGLRRGGYVMAFKADGKTELGWVQIEGTELPTD